MSNLRKRIDAARDRAEVRAVLHAIVDLIEGGKIPAEKAAVPKKGKK